MHPIQAQVSDVCVNYHLYDGTRRQKISWPRALLDRETEASSGSVTKLGTVTLVGRGKNVLCSLGPQRAAAQSLDHGLTSELSRMYLCYEILDLRSRVVRSKVCNKPVLGYIAACV